VSARHALASEAPSEMDNERRRADSMERAAHELADLLGVPRQAVGGQPYCVQNRLRMAQGEKVWGTP
jgi:hypothetical protein